MKRDRETETERETDRDRQTDRQRQTDRDRDRQTDRQTDREDKENSSSRCTIVWKLRSANYEQFNQATYPSELHRRDVFNSKTRTNFHAVLHTVLGIRRNGFVYSTYRFKHQMHRRDAFKRNTSSDFHVLLHSVAGLWWNDFVHSKQRLLKLHTANLILPTFENLLQEERRKVQVLDPAVTSYLTYTNMLRSLWFIDDISRTITCGKHIPFFNTLSSTLKVRLPVIMTRTRDVHDFRPLRVLGRRSIFWQTLDNSKYKKLNRNSVSSALHRSLSLSKESYTVYVNIFERILWRKIFVSDLK